MKEPDQSANGGTPEEDFGLKQAHQLAAEIDHWLELFDTELSHQELSLSKRPFQALMMLFRDGAIKVNAGEEQIDEAVKLGEHMEKPWFRTLFGAVEYWYVDRYGANAMEARGTTALLGAVMIRGVPFAISVPANRTKVEMDGETAWMYFEEGIGDGEDAVSWIVNGPDLSKLDQDARALVVTEARQTVEVLRYVEFRRVTSRSSDDHEVQKLIQTTLTYLKKAAERLVSFQTPEIGLAWFDLQMANEAALKAVIRKKTCLIPHIHQLDTLLMLAGKHGVTFDATKFSKWPSFKDVSAWRYGLGNPPGIRELYGAYRLTLDLAQVSMSQIVPAMKPGFGFLIRYSPWKMKDAAGRFRE
jgi:hypothetical protein